MNLSHHLRKRLSIARILRLPKCLQDNRQFALGFSFAIVIQGLEYIYIEKGFVQSAEWDANVDRRITRDFFFSNIENILEVCGEGIGDDEGAGVYL